MPSTPLRNYYIDLGITITASDEEVKLAYRRLAREHHPDRNQGSATSAARFLVVTEAYDTLRDPAKRRQYDRLLRFEGTQRGSASSVRERAAGRGFQPGMVDRAMAHAAAQAAKHRAERDARARRATHQPRDDKRPSWAEHDDEYGRDEAATAFSGATLDVQCTVVITLAQAVGHDEVVIETGLLRPCPACADRSIPARAVPCATCTGRGVVERMHRIRFRLSGPVYDGGQIRLDGYGHQARVGGLTGGAVVRIEFAKDPRFTLHGDGNIRSNVVLHPEDFVLGATVEIPGIAGPTAVVIPPGTTPGAPLHIEGAGLWTPVGTRGRHYLATSVRLPKAPGDEERALFEALRVLRSSPHHG